MIGVLLEYCQKQLLLPELLRGVREHNPRQYERYEVRPAPERGEAAGAEVDLRLLSRQGFVMEDASMAGGWRVRPLAFLWWLGGELRHIAAAPGACAAWLHAQGLDGLLTPHEEELLAGALQAAGGPGEGATAALMEAAIRGE